MNNAIAHFSLWGDFEVDDITKLLGMKPSCVYLKGEVLEGASSPAISSSWDLHCPSERNQSVQEQITALLAMLAPKNDVLRSLGGEYHAALNLTASGNDVLSLDRDLIRKLSELNLNVYCFSCCDEDANAD